jgi:hypothetical protein
MVAINRIAPKSHNMQAGSVGKLPLVDLDFVAAFACRTGSMHTANNPGDCKHPNTIQGTPQKVVLQQPVVAGQRSSLFKLFQSSIQLATMLQRFGTPRAPVAQRALAGRSRTILKVQAVFEKFTERSIKSVMLAQQEAKLLGASEVGFFD